MTPVTEIKVFPIAKSVSDLSAIRQWLASMNAKEFDFPSDSTSAEDIIGLAGKRCYNSFQPGLNKNVTKVTDVLDSWAKYLDNILRSGHGSVLEHASWTWAIENCTRVFTAEMNRHRAGVAISEASLRYIRFDNIKFWMPLSIRADPNDSPDLAVRKTLTRNLFERVFKAIELDYRYLEGVWDIDNITNFDEKKKLTSMFRRIIPLGVCVGAVYTLNVRALRHVITMRSSEHAEEEIAHVIGMIAKEMCESEPSLFGDFVNENGFWRPKYVKV